MHRNALLFAMVIAAGGPLCAVNIQTARPGFEENNGQFPANVLYALRPIAYLTSDSLMFSRQPVSIQFEGRNPATVLSGLDTLSDVVNVYRGNKAFTGIRRYHGVRYSGLYPGIDLEFAAEDSFTFRFIVQPGANLARVVLRYTGDVRWGGDSQLVLGLAGSFRWGQNSIAYQPTPLGRVPVVVRYREIDSSRWGFSVESPLAGYPVVIETTIPAAGAGPLRPRVVSVAGKAFGAGPTDTLINACGSDMFRAPRACHDGAVTGYAADGTLRWTTYLEGSLEDAIDAVTLDRGGNNSSPLANR